MLLRTPTLQSGHRRSADPPASPVQRNDLAVGQRDAAVHARGELEVVGGDQRREARLPAPARPAPRTHRTRSSGSRLPVGSSASSSRGALATARAMATRCCSPPESSAGRWCGALADLHVVEQLRGRARAASLARQARDQLRHHDVLERRELRQQVMELVDEADIVAADRGALVVGQPAAGAAGQDRRRRRRAAPAGRRCAAASTCRRPTARPAPPSRRASARNRRRSGW